MNYKAIIALAILFSCATLSCKDAKPDDREKFFPVLSFLQSQVADIDTSLYSIRKLIIIDSLHTDTLYIKREDFRAEAKDFLSIPDISDPKFRDRFTEAKIQDEMLNRVLLTYLPVNISKEEIQREEVVIKSDPTGDKVTNIIINTVVNNRDSAVEKHMLWQVGQSFRVTTTRQLVGQPETTSIVKVVWNENE